MLNLIQADLFKMRKSSAIKILFGITTLCAIVMTVMAYLIPKGQISDEYIGMVFLISDIVMMGILGAVTASVFICGDFENKTIHDAIASGCSRGTVIVSKAIVFFCGVGFILLPYAIITGIALSTGSKFEMGTVSMGFLNMLTKESGLVFSTSVLLKMLAAAFTLILVYMAQLSVCVPLALMLKKPVLVVAIFYGFTIFCANLTGLRNSSETFDKIFSYTPYGGKYSFVTLSTEAGDFVKAIAVSLFFIIVILGVTYSVFRKSEIK